MNVFSAHIQDYTIKKPGGVAVSSDGHILVVDSGSSQVLKFTKQGALVARMGVLGSGPGTRGLMELNDPTSIAVHPRNGIILIADRGNRRIQVMNPDFTYAG